MRTLSLALTAISLGLALALAPDAHADLDAVAQAMGTAKVDNVQISGTGHAYAVGQAFQPGQAWPKMNLVRYTRIDDYAEGGARLRLRDDAGPRSGAEARSPRWARRAAPAA